MKGELREEPRKALRFGAVFSVIFTILCFAGFAGLKAAIRSIWL